MSIYWTLFVLHNLHERKTPKYLKTVDLKGMLRWNILVIYSINNSPAEQQKEKKNQTEQYLHLYLIHLRQTFPSYKNQTANSSHCKSIDWFLYYWHIALKQVHNSPPFLQLLQLCKIWPWWNLKLSWRKSGTCQSLWFHLSFPVIFSGQISLWISLLTRFKTVSYRINHGRIIIRPWINL